MTSLRTVLLAIAIAATSVVGCASHSVQPSNSAASATPAIKPPGSATIGDRTRCPVTGEEFTVTAQSPKAEVGGKTYYFCCPDCVPTFQANPSKYIGTHA